MKNAWRTIPQSDHYHRERFVNLSNTPMMAKGVSMLKVMRAMMRRPKLSRPQHPLPFVRTDLRNPPAGKPTVTWFGHSSYLIQFRGYNILVDPVFSGYASPVAGFVKAFEGSNEYQPSDFPPIDLMVITHNHYDHLDKGTIRKFSSTTKRFLTGLGVGRDLAAAGVDPSLIEESDWWEEYSPAEGIRLQCTPARHFSGRGLVRGGSLWSSFALNFYGHNIFIGGDSGYDTFFTTIGERCGPFELAILECGQYDQFWPDIHMMPEQTALAATQLRAAALLPVHWGKFTLANHVWDEPVKRVLVAAAGLQLPVVTPMIGERFMVGGPYPAKPWW
ncbi:MAG: MBL fold metallo-hydrolase [Chitinophagaceae bacterium]|nr:MAG: MBL fold metallo-hydrolase [Chitinophagaceae bacterium]